VGLVLLVALVVGFATVQYVRLSTGITKSHIFSGPGAGAAGLGGRSLHGDVNLLVIGLDSRLDENGRPLPADTYGRPELLRQGGGRGRPVVGVEQHRELQWLGGAGGVEGS